jgi:hypothetical protein
MAWIEQAGTCSWRATTSFRPGHNRLDDHLLISTTPDVPPGRIPPPTPTIPTTPPKTVPTTQPLGNRPFTGTIWVRHPLFGETLASGEALSGEVTGWTTGHQVWLSSRAEGSSAELVQGPCQVNGSTFTCPEVQLAGASGTREYIHVAVVTDEAAGQLNDANTSPLDNASASDQTQIYKG